ncbi:TetR family transcriptional regulator [Saccharospirillum mangrovi]|uniref:TetR family transcriptional regulator n=1 Tax=Saccharospirillum mangrovi TaxID=2161747 RepID=UPI000D3D1C02|nr:TetR family transcriptional regulator [Saccharospirillum mangrovi]
MKQRARSAQDKQQRFQALLDAAERLALEQGGVRFLTVAAVTERAGLHRTGVRRYFANKEEMLLELAERGWGQWRDRIEQRLGQQTDLTPIDVADIATGTITSMSVFCDLLTHVTLSLEGSVDIERARRFKTNAFAAFDDIVKRLSQASVMTPEQVQEIMGMTTMLAASFWQASHPTPTLAELYRQEPKWGHVALDFGPRLKRLLRAAAVGLTQQRADTD